GGSVLPFLRLSLPREARFPIRAAGPVPPRAAVDHVGRLRLRTPPMAAGHPLRPGLSRFGDPQESPRRRDYRARDHEPARRRLGRVEGGVALLVNSPSVLTHTH